MVMLSSKQNTPIKLYLIRFSRENAYMLKVSMLSIVSGGIFEHGLVCSMVKSARLEIWRSVVQILVQVKIFLLKI